MTRKRSKRPKPATTPQPRPKQAARTRVSARTYLLCVSVGVLLVSALGGWVLFRTNVADPGRQVLDSHDQPVGPPPALKILCPFDGSVFPPEIAPPRFHWEDGTPRVDRWTVTIDFADDGMPMRFFCDSRQWAPASDVWQQIKNRSLSGATVTVGGVNRLWPEDVLSSDRVSISTSTNEVGAPIFYREVNLPFLDAVKDPAAHIRWRFGSISSSEQPPVVLEKMPLCGNCHSFSQDGGLIGMDVDYGSDKGSYVICPVSEDMVYDNAKIITWSDYAREDNRGTLGLLSQVSPDGRYVISTVKDRSIFAAVDSLEFSQLFFPIQGILAYYDRQTKEFHALHGADDGRYVQSNAAWSPDGKYLVFARSEAFFSDAFREKHGGLTKPEDVSEFLLARKSFQFELRRIPFNDGKGGESEPLRGASNNGMSNYFPKYSPDGKWIVFCQARSYMLLQADSALYIVPAEGGEARRLECNTSRMNSWHSWSPNGRWLVFSSKAYSPYTQLFLAHIDEEGRASPPVVLSHFTSEDRAANIPEFVNASPDAIRSIRAEFIDDLSYLQAGKVNVNEGQHAEAIHNFQKALEINPENIEARLGLGGELLGQDRLDEAQHHFDETLARDPTNQDARCFLGAIRESRGDLPEAMKIYRQVLQAKPEHAMTHLAIGRLSLKTGETEEGRHHLLEAARLMPGNASPYLDLAASYAGQQNADQAIAMYRLALARSPDSDAALVGLALALLEVRRPRDIDEAMGLATKACQVTQQASPLALMVLAEAQAAAGRSSEAVATVRKAMDLAERTGRADLVEAGRTLLEQYQQP